jgi:hypothetical protein
MKKKRPELAGEFSKPIVRPAPLAVALLCYDQPEHRKRKVIKASRVWPAMEQYNRICLVAQKYGITSDGVDFWRELSVALCNEFIEETRIHESKPKGRGAPKQYGFELIAAIKEITKSGASTAEACRLLVKSEGAWKGKNWKTIESRYYEIESEAAEFMKTAPSPFLDHAQSIRRGELDSVNEPEALSTAAGKGHDNSSH